jgi:hypothetical protein
VTLEVIGPASYGMATLTGHDEVIWGWIRVPELLEWSDRLRPCLNVHYMLHDLPVGRILVVPDDPRLDEFDHAHTEQVVVTLGLWASAGAQPRLVVHHSGVDFATFTRLRQFTPNLP